MTRTLSFSAALALLALLALCASHAAFAADLDGADLDGDGRIDREEFVRARSELFTRLDRNRDGVLDAVDHGRRRRAAGPAGAQVAAAFARFDLDGDGRVTRDELAAAPTTAFDAADANDDGVVDRDERERASRSTRRTRGRMTRSPAP